VAENSDQKLQYLPSKGENVEGLEVIILCLSDVHGRKREKPQKVKKPLNSKKYL
jgi:hypothetical protein